ncbi:hypothetical protein N9731_03530 [Gammaproteobacteria bacterium]|nr:hypothetical protein [Gammaproteobacteria bacterium]
MQKTPLNRLLAKVQYNCVFAWMVSDSSNYFKGAIINVDGGRTGW